MTEDRMALLICQRSDLLALPIPGTIVVTADCGHEVFLAPSGQKIREQHEARLYCGECAHDLIAREADAGTEIQRKPLNLEQSLELDAARRRS